jgi:4-hydroxybenzoate polyprenyltransferase
VRWADTGVQVLVLARVHNGLLTGLGVAMGFAAAAAYAGSSPPASALALAVAAAACLASGGCVVNDLFDAEIDRANRLDRPLATGRLPRPAAWALYGIVSAVGVALAWAAGWRSGCSP